MNDASLAFPFRVVAAGLTDIGRIRQHNEDTVLLRNDLNLFMVADGAGGHEAGNVASALAVTTVAHYFEETAQRHEESPLFDSFGLPMSVRRLSSALHRANKEVLEVAVASNRHKGMGTTIVVAWLEPRTCLLHVGHVGDSRCYRLRGRHLEALTQDHSLINEVLEMRPDLDDTVLSKLPRHVVTRALGMGESIRTTLRSYELAPGDKYLLCSDGLHGLVPDHQIAEALAIERTPEEQARLLIEMAKEAGSRDNIAALVIECEPLPEILLQPRKSSYGDHSSPDLLGEAADDAPEIVLLDQTDDDAPAMVPAQTGTPSIRNALVGFIGPMRPHKKG